MRRVALVVCALVACTATAVHAADDPTRAPDTTLSADGRSATDGRRTLTASQARDLKAEVQSVTVEGSGYDTNKGIYVAFCVIPPNPQTAPGPCGGGQDRTGQNGGAAWVSSNPPAYAPPPLTTPYGKGGTFRVSINVQAQLNEDTDCRVVRCAVTTRHDHTRSTDRSQDILVPVYFQGGFGPPPPGASPSTPTTARDAASRGRGTTTTTIAAALAAPLATVSEDGKSISAGTMTLTASKAKDLTPGSQVTVSGAGYDTEKGIYVSLCFISAQNSPGPCASGSAGQSAWISSNPPDYGKALAKAYGEGGSFDVTLTLDPVIDADHDCTKVACALATRNDDTHPDDRSQDLMLPVSFSEKRPSKVQSLTRERADNSSSALPMIAGGVAIAAALTAGGVALARRRRTDLA